MHSFISSSPLRGLLLKRVKTSMQVYFKDKDIFWMVFWGGIVWSRGRISAVRHYSVFLFWQFRFHIQSAFKYFVKILPTCLSEVQAWSSPSQTQSCRPPLSCCTPAQYTFALPSYFPPTFTSISYIFSQAALRPSLPWNILCHSAAGWHLSSCSHTEAIWQSDQWVMRLTTKVVCNLKLPLW